MSNHRYPVPFSVDQPDGPLDRTITAFWLVPVVTGVLRWGDRVTGDAVTLVADRYAASSLR